MSTTVILGAGIIGVSTAYYLSADQSPSTIHLVEPSPELFSSASGFAGGFLAKDWFLPEVAPLGELSFELHGQLAASKGGRQRWGYSTTGSFSYTASADDRPSGRLSDMRGIERPKGGGGRSVTATSVVGDGAGEAPPWLRRRAGDAIERIGEEGTTAQVDPLHLSQFLLRECLDRGVHLHHPAAAISVQADVRGELASVRIADTQTSTEIDLPCARVVITAGAWSPKVLEGLFRQSRLKLPIASLAGHSLVMASPRWTRELEGAGCHAVYMTSSQGFSVEIFSRLGGDIYVAGVNSSTIPLPEVAGQSGTQETAVTRLKQAASDLLGIEGGGNDLEVVREALCFRPVTLSGRPIISRVADIDLGVGMKTRPGAEGGVYVAAGHGPWGISLSLGTGLVLAEMVQGRPLSADVTALTFV